MIINIVGPGCTSLSFQILHANSHLTAPVRRCPATLKGLVAWNSVRVLLDEHCMHSLFLQPLDRRGTSLGWSACG